MAFLVDDLLKTVLDYIKDRIGTGRKEHDEAIKHSRVAMRELAKSLTEIHAILTKGVHRLERDVGNQRNFRAVLAALVDEERLNHACNESGICKDLRIAEDELLALSKLYSSKKKSRIEDLSRQISEHEADFVRAIREFLSAARECDLTAAAHNTKSERITVVNAFKERLATLASKVNEIEDVLNLFREHDVTRRPPRT